MNDLDFNHWTPARAETTAQRWQEIVGEVAELAEASGRPKDAVTILPTTKNQPDQAVELLYSLGQRTFAESRVQELARKASQFDVLDGIEWVMIGHLQRNKARDAAMYAKRFEALDSIRIARALSTRIANLADSAQHADITDPMPVLIQVNASGEKQKHGLAPAEVPALLEELAEIPHLRVEGFMTMAPHVEDQSIIRSTFAAVRDLRDELQPTWQGRFDLGELSFGMSHDYPLAIAEGSTQVRLGTVIFGERDYSLKG